LFQFWFNVFVAIGWD